MYSVQLVVRRLWFHPLSHIPGPFLARATYWYETYQDVWLGGMYVKNYAALHEIYGESWGLETRANLRLFKLAASWSII